MINSADRGKSPLPRSYHVWLPGALASLLGDAVLHFALGRAAATHGGKVAGPVLTAINPPRVRLLIAGRTVRDRPGARRVTIAGDGAMLAGTVAMAVVAHEAGPAASLLVAAGLPVGVKDAFHLPASGSMPLRLMGKEPLPHTPTMRQGGGAQLVTFVAGPLDGILMTTGALTGTALLNTATFMVVLVIDITVHPAHDTPPAQSSDSLPHDALNSITIGWKDPIPRAALITTARAAGLPRETVSSPVMLAEARHPRARRTSASARPAPARQHPCPSSRAQRGTPSAPKTRQRVDAVLTTGHRQDEGAPCEEHARVGLLAAARLWEVRNCRTRARLSADRGVPGGLRRRAPPVRSRARQSGPSPRPGRAGPRYRRAPAGTASLRFSYSFVGSWRYWVPPR
ncbi:hypothetical protein [Streptomyces sp. NPDC003435]